MIDVFSARKSQRLWSTSFLAVESRVVYGITVVLNGIYPCACLRTDDMLPLMAGHSPSQSQQKGVDFSVLFLSHVRYGIFGIK